MTDAALLAHAQGSLDWHVKWANGWTPGWDPIAPMSERLNIVARNSPHSKPSASGQANAQ
jgi:hypothetical protein